jgi:two-component system, response regulator YesN
VFRNTEYRPGKSGGGGVVGMIETEQINERALEYYPSLRRVRDYIDKNYSDCISLEQAAQIAGMERKYFSTFFHRKVGVCFRYWLTGVRIKHALRLMKAENISITHAAYATGFNDLRTFERAFKRCIGSTPLQYKNGVERSIHLG